MTNQGKGWLQEPKFKKKGIKGAKKGFIALNTPEHFDYPLLRNNSIRQLTIQDRYNTWQASVDAPFHHPLWHTFPATSMTFATSQKEEPPL
jgi:hypothetical protein